MEMIDIAINPINEFIKSFFNELKSNLNLVNNDDEVKNILNINGSWGSGKSTIVNNLEYYYQSENKKEKPNFFIFNLWEYETLSEPFFYLVKDLLNKIFFNISNDYVTQKAEIIKKVKKWTIGLTFKLPFLDIKIENEQKKRN
ncbi:P-loop NTPase fold protein [Spiroplasma sp. AdecLV25b]|uniref:P-loop NTPase fold protein n=1 Tax=Spiroplasma sp. AdecLV25b TaxID=3027162 RepID=UPI0027E2021C|nr:P-loop NTPase fold protein [Spiroplasma sp. AdecLV25b]